MNSDSIFYNYGGNTNKKKTLIFAMLIVAIVVLKLFKISYNFGFSVSGIREGLKRYAIPGIVAGILSFAAFFIGLFPFDYKPTIWKILIEGILYYIGVGIVEEFYVLCHIALLRT